MLPEYELTEGMSDTVISACSVCGCEFVQTRWQFEVDVEEEGDSYQPVCTSCQGLEDLL